MGVSILGHGHATPRRRVENSEIERELGLDPGWIERRTGVRARRLCAPEESCSTLAVEAGRRALARAGVDPASVGLVLLATSTPDRPLPPTAPSVADSLGLRGAGAVDLAGACAGFLYGFVLAEAWVRLSGRVAVVVAANVLSRRCDPADAGARAIFADGAGAMVLGPTPEEGVLGRWLSSDGRGAELIRVDAGGSLQPIQADTHARGLHHLRIHDPAAVFTDAVAGMTAAGLGALREAGLESAGVDLWIPHQANARILRRVGPQLQIDEHRWFISLAEWGNSSAASLPTAFSLAAESGRITHSDRILLTAVGAGTVSAGLVVRGPVGGAGA